jgi:hypothetical protein
MQAVTCPGHKSQFFMWREAGWLGNTSLKQNNPAQAGLWVIKAQYDLA